MAEPPMPATTRPSGRVPWLQAGRLDLPQRVAQVLGDREDVGQLVGRIDPADRLAVKLELLGAGQDRPSSSERDGAFGQVRLREDSHAARQDVARPHGHALAEHRAAGDLRSPPRRGRRRRRCSRAARSPAPISAPLRTTERSIVRALPDAHALAEHDQRADVRALRRSRSRARPAPAARCARRTPRARRRPGSRAPRRSRDGRSRRCPRGCRRCPAGSARECRCPASRRPRRSRRAPRPPAAATPRARSRRCDRPR